MKRFSAKTVTIDEIELSLKEIQEPFNNMKMHGEVQYVLQKSDGKFLIVWFEEKVDIMSTRPSYYVEVSQ